MVFVEPPNVSGIQPMGVLGAPVMAYFRIPPYLLDEGTVADEEVAVVAEVAAGLEVVGGAPVVAEVGTVEMGA